jgi:hypothetical protein
LLSKKWKTGHFVLFEDSTIQWFESEKDKKPEGSIKIKDVCQWLCVGPYTRSIKGRPDLPPKGDENLLIYLPKDAEKKEKECLWILCRDLDQLKFVFN